MRIFRADHQIILFVVLLVALRPLYANAALPAAQGPITDLANVLSASARQQAADRIREVQEKTTAEIAVAVVPSLDGMSVEEYANQLFAKWGIGKKGRDNGVLILVAPTERRVRIEVGYGLEPVLPDGLAGDIIRRDVLPQFRVENYEAGILAAIARVTDIVEKNETVPADVRAAMAQQATARGWPKVTAILGFLTLFGAGAIGAGLINKNFGTISFGLPFGGIPAFLALIDPVQASPVLLAGLAIGGFLLGLLWMLRRDTATARKLGVSRAELWRTRAWTMGRYGSSGSSSGSWSSGSSSSSSSSSSSFGGGSSGGGGASGSW